MWSALLSAQFHARGTCLPPPSFLKQRCNQLAACCKGLDGVCLLLLGRKAARAHSATRRGRMRAEASAARIVADSNARQSVRARSLPVARSADKTQQSPTPSLGSTPIHTIALWRLLGTLSQVPPRSAVV